MITVTIKSLEEEQYKWQVGFLSQVVELKEEDDRLIMKIGDNECRNTEVD